VTAGHPPKFRYSNWCAWASTCKRKDEKNRQREIRKSVKKKKEVDPLQRLFRTKDAFKVEYFV
jgi:hypothetical protein